MYACTLSEVTNKGSEYPHVPVMSQPVRNQFNLVFVKLFYKLHNRTGMGRGDVIETKLIERSVSIRSCVF